MLQAWHYNVVGMALVLHTNTWQHVIVLPERTVYIDIFAGVCSMTSVTAWYSMYMLGSLFTNTAVTTLPLGVKAHQCCIVDDSVPNTRWWI